LVEEVERGLGEDGGDGLVEVAADLDGEPIVAEVDGAAEAADGVAIDFERGVAFDRFVVDGGGGIEPAEAGETLRVAVAVVGDGLAGGFDFDG
jgi:hypothetical protein